MTAMSERPRFAFSFTGMAGLLLLLMVGTSIVALMPSLRSSHYDFVLSSTSEEMHDKATTRRSLQDDEGTATFALTMDATVATSTSTSPTPSTGSPTWSPTIDLGDNPCQGKAVLFPLAECVLDGIPQTAEQSPVNVTRGYNGLRASTVVPLTVPFWQAGQCPVGVYFKLGAEHYSVGQYDEMGTGPDDPTAQDRNQGYQCNHYDKADPKFTTDYNWQHCDSVMVGQTYEVQWTHSAAGACGTIWQYQSPFFDGVFCQDGLLTDTASQLGVQAQVFTIVNDNAYYYHDLMRGMVVDGVDRGTDLAMYTGSYTLATGGSTLPDNAICSQYAPVTWHVDRTCHLISASAFDKLCEDMKRQRDDMMVETYPKHARVLVSDELAANNQVSGGDSTASIGKR